MIKESLITSGYPRSGNTFLNFALKSIYFPNQMVNSVNHTVVAIEKKEKIIVPFRYPLDCIASWVVLNGENNLIDDINFYLRFTKATLHNINKIILMDFNYFTKDLEYIKKKIKHNFNFDLINNSTIKEIKNLMLKDDKAFNLPQKNTNLLNNYKSKLKKMPEFQECIDLYLKLKNSSC